MRIGRLGQIEFKPGYYIYVGSALNSIEKRIQRHLGVQKKLFWHIDYMLQEADIIKVFLIESHRKLECRIAEKLSKLLPAVPGFGCSDCKCGSHLFYHDDENIMKSSIMEVLHDMGIGYKVESVDCGLKNIQTQSVQSKQRNKTN